VSTNSLRRNSFPGIARSNSTALLVCALLAFSSIAALGLKMLRSTSEKQLVETSPAAARGNSSPPPDGAHFREIAQGLRVLARGCRYPGARTELLQLAASLERGADHLEARQRPLADLDPSAG
jgi:hypothetical protein